MRLVRLRLVRTPGIREGFTLEPAPGLNLVTGPNGIGKSSICRAVLNMLWPGANGEGPFEAEAEFENESRTLAVTRQDYDSPVWNGPRPALGPDHLANRYRLGVLDLLLPDPEGDPLAREIRKHMAGGFDLELIRDRHFQGRTGRSENSAIKATDGRVAGLRAGQRVLASEQDRLAGLEERRDQAGRARDRIVVLESLRDLSAQKAAWDEAASRVEKLPAAAELVRPEDPQKIADLRRRERDHEQDMEERSASLKAAGKDLGELQTPGDAPLGLMKKKLENLVDLGRDLRQAERDAQDSHLEEVLTDSSRKPSLIPIILALLGGVALMISGWLLVLPGNFTSLVLVALGGGAVVAGGWGLLNYSKAKTRAGLALDKRKEIARKKDYLAGCRAQRDEALADFGLLLKNADLPPVTDHDAAAQLVADLENRGDQMRSLQNTRDSDTEFLERERRHLDRVRTEIQDLFRRLDLEANPQADAEVSHLLELKPRLDNAIRDCDNATREIDRLEKGLAAGTALLRDGESPDTPPGILNGLIDQERDLAEEFESLVEEIARIREKIDLARRGHDLQEAQVKAEAARDALENTRQVNREAALGRLLLDRVEHQHELESRPLVLEKADEYFGLFTGHRYSLTMAAQGEGKDRFLALPENSVQPLELGQLSDGTRAQLLLAVKLAFITTGEESSRPPIFLDDSLTSADPERFAAVAASLGRLADTEKRQVFYLTPNPADAAAFTRALEGAGLPAAHHTDLAELRGRAGAADPALLDPDNLPANLMAPDPSGMSAARYAEALLVPRPDPWAPRGALHVFFLLQDDLDLIRRLVDGNGETLKRFGGVKITLTAANQITADETAKVETREKVWSAWLDGWRIGRARPVTRGFLDESEAVSKTYRDQVVAVLEKRGWDGARLLEAIEAKEVKGFRANKRDQLRQELEDADLLDPRATLTDEKLLTHTLDRVAPLLASNILDMQKVRTLALTFARLVESSNKKSSPPTS